MARPLNPFNFRDAVRRYKAGESRYKIAEEIHISPRTFVRRMKAAGVYIRSRSEAKSLEWKIIDAQGRHDAEVARRLTNAHKASRGRTVSMMAKILMANASAGRINGRDIPKHESELAGRLETMGVKAAWQHPIGPYKADLAIEARRVAVEIQRSNWTLAVQPGGTLSKQRLEYILNAGWHLIVVYCPPRRMRVNAARNRRECIERFDGESVANKLVAMLHSPGVFPSSPCQYGVIDGYAKASPVVRLDLDGRPRIPGA